MEVIGIIMSLFATAVTLYFIRNIERGTTYFIYTNEAQIPFKKHFSDAGWDLKAAEDKIIQPGEYELIDTDIIVAIPEGFFGHILPRSSLALNHGIMTMAGVIDSGYRDTIKVLLYNAGKTPFKVNKGDRIAQLVVQKINLYAEPIHLTDAMSKKLFKVERGKNGFGSSGIN